jgi:hypothetical protein
MQFERRFATDTDNNKEFLSHQQLLQIFPFGCWIN